ncbi:MAG: hypothetical protein IKA22_03045 [Lentisphaeria bacterium]|nr:hypothetical protein [Lentisphaeria bacterium]
MNNKETKTCGECRYHKNNRCMLPCYAMNHWAENPACHHFEGKIPPTKGDKIRQMSDEELAEKLVYSEWIEAFDKQLLVWHSTVLPFSQHFLSRPEAIAATVAEFKKGVEKG